MGAFKDIAIQVEEVCEACGGKSDCVKCELRIKTGNKIAVLRGMPKEVVFVQDMVVRHKNIKSEVKNVGNRLEKSN
jgi:Na+-transporting NADH:ubiquinone oxidoreductase subunit NqrF